MRTLLKQGRVTDVPVAFVKRDGRPIRCQVTARAVFDEDGIAMMLDGIIKDVSWEWTRAGMKQQKTVSAQGNRVSRLEVRMMNLCFLIFTTLPEWTAVVDDKGPEFVLSIASTSIPFAPRRFTCDQPIAGRLDA